MVPVLTVKRSCDCFENPLFRETKFIPSITIQLLETSFFYKMFHYSPSEVIIRRRIKGKAAVHLESWNPG